MYTASNSGHTHRGNHLSYQRTVQAAVTPGAAIDGARIAGWLLRGWMWILIAVLLGAVGGVVIAQLLTPRFTSATELTISPSNLLLAPNDLYANNIQSDSQILDVESKMRMITSGNVLRRVIDTLDLKNDAEFADKPQLFGLGFLFNNHQGAAGNLVNALAKRVTVSRQERSYVVTLSVWASEPEEAARLANTIAATFSDEVVRADSERAGRAAQALAARLGELKAAATEADDKIEAFRRTNGLQQGATGKPLSFDAVEQMNAKLTDAKARAAEAEARYSEVSRAVTSYGAEGGGVQSPILSGLIASEAALRRQIATLSQTLGKRHPALLNALAEAGALDQAIKTETERLRRAARIDLDQSRKALDALNAETRTLRNNASADDQAQVKLRELKREASAKTELYQTFLSRAGEAAERQQIDATDVRVISPAIAPQRPTWPPRPTIAAAAGAALGLLLACGLLTGFGFLRFGGFRPGRSAA